jgi:chaperone required for assembly of F1-ATPase
MTGNKGKKSALNIPPIKDTLLKPLPKRFYKDVAIVVDPKHGHVITLDGRRAHTPRKKVLAAPVLSLAEKIAEEWRLQIETINPAQMPLTTLLCTALDAVTGREGDVAADIAKYAGSDLLCYRADNPAKLVARQTASWNPLLTWAKSELGAGFKVTTGLIHVAQPATALDAIASAITANDALTLAGLHVLTTITGSVILALAVHRRHLTLQQAWSAAHIDEDWQIEQWGTDYEAEDRRAKRLRDAKAAAFVLTMDKA